MNTNDLDMALYEKMAAEQDKYRDWLKSQPPEEILHHTYECFILGKHTARNGVAGISPPRREFQKC